MWNIIRHIYVLISQVFTEDWKGSNDEGPECLSTLKVLQNSFGTTDVRVPE